MKRFPAQYLGAFSVFKKLNTPARVQDFVETFPINFERKGSTCRSPLTTLRVGTAHCIEGALLAAAAFWYHGERPFLLDLKTGRGDESHVVALFKRGGRWGAVSKTNHAVLRYREPVYVSPRELTMSYFHEYFLDNGRKTLKSHSAPFDLLLYKRDWLTSKKDLWDLIDKLDRAPHFQIVPAGTKLRPADIIERRAGKITQWKR
ncbi:MAG: hypothetical protein HYU81_00280 [Candidatus Brennerbacteria bacterium]|nr:hypothetical protein [Candidatus Brennerbacteria bacterium]